MPATRPPRKPRDEASGPGLAEAEAAPRLVPEPQPYRASGKLDGRVVLITGGESGLGRAVAILFAREGANVAIVHRGDAPDDAEECQALVEAEGRRCLAIAGDVGDEQVCREAVLRTVNEFERLDVLVNNAAEQHPQDDLLHIAEDQLVRSFRTNVFGAFFMAKACLKHLDKGSAIINSASIAAYRGSAKLIDYAATEGAVVAFTRSLALSLAERHVRVNAVASGANGHAGEPESVAPCYVFLASGDSGLLTGQVLHPNGGEIVNG
jgi:NAD(P)-dependent dehydrogenase (short-subunit alcohol dehydrogenase family)